MSSWILLLAAAAFFAVLAIVLHVVMISRYPEERARVSRRGKVAPVKPTVEPKPAKVKAAQVKAPEARPAKVKAVKARPPPLERPTRVRPIRPAPPIRDLEPLFVEPAAGEAVEPAGPAPVVAQEPAPIVPTAADAPPAPAAPPPVAVVEPAPAGPEPLAEPAVLVAEPVAQPVPEAEPAPQALPEPVLALLAEAEALLAPEPEPEPQALADIIAAAQGIAEPDAALPDPASADPLAAAIAALPAAPVRAAPASPDPARAVRRLLATHGPGGTEPDPGRLVFDAAEITRENSELGALVAAELARHAAEPAWRSAGLDFDQRLAEGRPPIVLGGVLDRLVAALGDEDSHIASRAGHVADDILAVGGLADARSRQALLTALAGAAVRHRPLPGGVVALAATLDRLEDEPATP